MKPLTVVTVFVAGLVVGHTFGTLYGAALVNNHGGCTKPHFTNYEG